MKSIWFWLAIAAAVLGAWWVVSRRRAGAPILPQVSGGGVLDAVQAGFNDLVGGRSQLAPVAPVQGSPNGSFGNQLAAGIGQAYAAGGTRICQSFGGPQQLCSAAGALNGKAAELIVQGHVKAVEYVGKGAKAVGSGVVTGVKKLKFW